MNRRVFVRQSSNTAGKTKKTRSSNQIKRQRDRGYKQIDKFNSNKAEQQQQKDIAAREAAQEHLGMTQHDFAERLGSDKANRQIQQ